FTTTSPGTINVDTAGRVHVTAADSGYVLIFSETRRDSVRIVVRQLAQNVVVVGGDDQIATVDHEVNDSLGVRVIDAAGNGIANAEVTWTIDEPLPSQLTSTGGGPSVENTAEAFTTFVTRTNATGHAKLRWRLGTHA